MKCVYALDRLMRIIALDNHNKLPQQLPPAIAISISDTTVSQSAPLENLELISSESESNGNVRKIFWRASRFKRQFGGGCNQICCCTAFCCCAQQQFPQSLPPAIIPPPIPTLPPAIVPPSPCCRICCQPSPIIQSPSTCCSPTSQGMIPQQPIPAPLPIPVVPLPPQIFPPAQMDRPTCCFVVIKLVTFNKAQHFSKNNNNNNNNNNNSNDSNDNNNNNNKLNDFINNIYLSYPL
ncbi:Serine/threonine-protein kinase [Dirofilaria immitis]